MRKLSLIVATLMLLIAPFATAQTFCNQTVIDQAHVIRNPQAVASAASTLINQGADVHVVTVNSASFQKYGQLAGVESYLESQCRNWTTNGTRKANLFVVMVAPNDRAKNMFVGSNYAGAFDIPSTYSQLSNSYFKNGDFGTGLAAALQGTTGPATTFHNRQFANQQQRQTAPPVQSRTYTPAATYTQPVQKADSGISGFAIFMIVLVVVIAIVVIIALVMRSNAGETTYVEHTTYTPEPTTYDGYSGGYRTRYAAAPGGTTVINNGPQYDASGNLITGVLLGEALSRNNNPTVVVQQNTPAYAPSPNYVDPTPNYQPPTPVQDAPDSTWEAPAQQTTYEPETTSFETQAADTSYDPPSSDTDFGSSDSGSSGGDSGF